MHFLASLTLAFALTTTTLAGKPVARDYYVANYAAIQTERLNTYAGTHKLTPEQRTAIDTAVELISSQDHSQITNVREAFEKAFSKDEASFLLTGREPTTHNDNVQTRRALLRRARDCNCSTDDNYCNDSQYCMYNFRDCKFSGGCGTFWLEECDGMCVKK